MGLTRPPPEGAAIRPLRVDALAIGGLPHFAVGLVGPAPGAILSQLHAVRIVAAVLCRGVIALPAVAALQGDDLPDVSGFSGHDL